MRLRSTITFVVMLLVASVASAQVPLGSGINTKGTGGISTSPGLVDNNGDGLYDYVKFPQDFDGDGTAWYTCDCGGSDGEAAAYTDAYICGTFRTSDTDYTQVDYSGTGGGASVDNVNNPAECRFHGQRVWDDTTDDINALYLLMTEGTEIEFEAGTYAMKGGDVPTSAHGAGSYSSTQCWDSTAGTYTDVCQLNEDGGSEIESAMIPYSNMLVHGAGVDNNGDMDLVYTGTMFVTNNGPRTFWGDDTNTVNNGSLHIGKRNVTGAGFQILADATFDTYEPSTICLDDDFVDNTLATADLVEVTISHPSTHLRRVLAYVEERTTTDCGTGGHEVVLSGAPPLTQHYGRDFTELGLSPPNSLFRTDYSTNLTNSTFNSGVNIDSSQNNQVAIVIEDRLTNSIRLSDLWFTHLDYVGAGGCEINDIETSECDNGILIEGYTGWGHTTERIGIIQASPAFGSGQAINTATTGSGHVWENSLFRFNQGGIIDVPQYGIFRNNVVTDNELIQNIDYTGGSAESMFLVRMQGDNYTIEDNKFLRNTGPAGDNDAGDMWNHYDQVKWFTSVIEMLGHYGTVRNNFFHMNQIGCIQVGNGARELVIEGNMLACGSYNHHQRFLTNQYDSGYPLIIRSKGQATPDATTGNILVRDNKFTGWGGRVFLDNMGLNEIDFPSYGIIPRAQVVLTGLNFNVDTATALDGDLFGTIVFDGNTFAASDDLWSHAVVMHTMRGLASNGISNEEVGDPDADRVIFTENHIQQGNLFGMVTIDATSITGAVLASDGDYDPDHNKDGTGLAQCGYNYDGKNVVLDFVHRQVDSEQGTTAINTTNVDDQSATQINQQCESFLD